MFGYKLLATFARMCGRSAGRVVLYPITLYYFLRRGPERRASRKYLQVITGQEVSLWQVVRHIHTFAATILDRLFLLQESFKRFDIRVHGLDELRKTWGGQRGVLVFGSHLGSFDALRALAQIRSDLTVRVVLDVEHNAELSNFLHALNPALARAVINPRQDGATTALAIKEALDEKSLVTLLVDRARPGNQVTIVDFLGRPAPFPTGPWQLAAALKAPVVLCFGLYRGGNRYDLHFEPFTDSLVLERSQREAGLKTTVQRYADRLAHYARLAPYNWFNFYDFWQIHDAPPAVERSAVERPAAERATASGASDSPARGV